MVIGNKIQIMIDMRMQNDYITTCHLNTDNIVGFNFGLFLEKNVLKKIVIHFYVGIL